MPARIELFGGLRLRLNGESIAVPISQKSGALLAYLAYHLGHETPRDVLIEMLWPDSDPELGRGRLRTVLSEMRKHLEAAGLDPSAAVSAARETVRLDESAVDSDVSRLIYAVQSPEAGIAELEHALAHSAAELLPGYYDDWVIAARERVAQLRCRGLKRLAAEYEAQGELAKAAESVQTLIDFEPLDEEAHCELMRLLIQAGNPTAALVHYGELERLLRDELETEPSARARKLADSARIERPASPGTRRAAMTSTIGTDDRAEAQSAPPISRRSRLAHALFILIALLAASGWFIAIWSKRKPTVAPAAAVRSTTGSESRYGHEAWIARYLKREDERDSEPTAITADIRGNLYICGFVDTQNNDADFLTLKLGPSGEQIWSRRYNGPSNDVDRARAIVLPPEGHLYVTGESDNGRGNGSTRLSGVDIALIKYDLDGKRLWVRRHNDPDNGEDWPIAIHVDRRGDIYVLGYSIRRRTGKDLVILRYTAAGSKVWATTIDGGFGLNDEPIGLGFDPEGGVYVGGTSQSRTAAGIESDYFLAKLDSSGTQIWSRRYGQGNQKDEHARALGVDLNRHAYVVGEAPEVATGSGDGRVGCVTVKFSPDGKFQWARGTTREDERLARVAAALVGGDGVVVLTGQRPPGAESQMVFREPTGTVRWIAHFADDTRVRGHALFPNAHFVYGTRVIPGPPYPTEQFAAAQFDHKGETVWKRYYAHPGGYASPAAAFYVHEPVRGLAVTGQAGKFGSRDIVTLFYKR